MPTGGSARGTTLIHGSYGIRLLDHHRRISAAQLKNGETVIRQRLKGMKYRLYTRICANIGVYTSGNEVRMGKGKGRFDYWAARVAVSKVIFEIEGGVHEKVAREAVRLAGNKLPGMVLQLDIRPVPLCHQPVRLLRPLPARSHADPRHVKGCMSLSKRAIRLSWASPSLPTASRSRR